MTDVYYIDACGPVVTETIVPGLRWRREGDREILQQRVEVVTRSGFNTKREVEWRDVPHE